MNKKLTGMLLVIMLVFNVMPASAGPIEDFNSAIDNIINQVKTLTFTSYASSVPVQISFDKPSNFWVLSATIGWDKDNLVLVKLPTGSQDSISGTTETAKTRKEITLSITPRGSYEIATLSKYQLHFKRNFWDNCGTTCYYGVTDYYQVEGANWITTTVYEASLNGNTQTIKVGMNYPADVNLGSGAFIKNLGILSNGANSPSGDYVIIKNPDNNQWEFYRYDSVQTSLNYWNNDVTSSNPTTTYTWYDVWQFLKSKNRLPVKPVMTAYEYIFNPTTTASQGTIQINYDKVAYSSSIVLYIPSSLADTITIQIGGSKAVILSKTDFKVTEGNSASFSVTVRNDGGDDYVTVKATSQYYTINPVTKFMKNGETQLFQLSAYALQIDGGDKTNLPISITADGTDPYSGDTFITVYGTTYDVPIVGPSSWKLTVIPKNPEGSVLSNADVYINNEKVFSGQNYVMKPRGDYTISGGNVTGLYTPTPAIVSIVDADKTVVLQYSTVPPEDDYTWIFWAILFGIGILGYAVTRHPVFLVFIGIIALLYAILMITTAISTL